MLRDADPQLERAHREEEIRLRGELAKKYVHYNFYLLTSKSSSGIKNLKISSIFRKS